MSTAETIGMSQREGSVSSHIRIGDEIQGSLIPAGQADLLIGLEPAETVRNLPFLKKAGKIIVNSHSIPPASKPPGSPEYDPAALLAFLEAHVPGILCLDFTQLAEEAGTYRAANVAMLGGDCYPASPLGINLPNSNWIRTEGGSKSVSLANITDAKDIVSRGSGFLEEFAYDQAEIERAVKWGSLSDALHTDMHECIGHASGKLAPGTDPSALKNYASPLEEMRADLFALYYMMDPKMTELHLISSDEIAKAEYDNYIRNGLLTQTVRIKPDKDIEQAHMRCRSAIAHWVFDKGQADNVIETVKRDGKSYVRINDYRKLRDLFGQMLREVQRIKSEGDFEAGKNMIETYGVKIDRELHKEMLARYEKLNLAPYIGFVNPVMTPVTDKEGKITDIKIGYCSDFLGQMMEYGKNYSFLPVRN